MNTADCRSSPTQLFCFDTDCSCAMLDRTQDFMVDVRLRKSRAESEKADFQGMLADMFLPLLVEVTGAGCTARWMPADLKGCLS